MEPRHPGTADGKAAHEVGANSSSDAKNWHDARQGQKIAGGSANFRPYGDDESKVRWLGMSEPKTLTEIPRPPYLLKDVSSVPSASPDTVFQALDDDVFAQTFQKVAGDLETLGYTVSSLGDKYRQEISDLRSENSALSLQIRRLLAQMPKAPNDAQGFPRAPHEASGKSKARFGGDADQEPEGQSQEVQHRTPQRNKSSDASSDNRLHRKSTDCSFEAASVEAYPSENFKDMVAVQERENASTVVSGEPQKQLKPSQSQATLGTLGGRFKMRGAWDNVMEDDPTESTMLQENSTAHSRSWFKKKHHNALRTRTSVFDMQSPSGARWTLHPHGRNRIIWNLLSLIAITYDIIMVPLSAFDIAETGAVLVAEWWATIFWTLDIAMTFMTGYYIGNAVEMRPYQIAKNYVSTWLPCDFGLVTLEWMARIFADETQVGSILRSARIFRIVRCIRLIRLGKLRSLMLVIEDKINSTLAGLLATLMKLIAALVILVHCITCGWYALGEAYEDGWTAYYAPSITAERDVYFWYFASSRWTLAQINGRTDMDERRTLFELVYTCMVAVVFAVIFMAVFISSITTTMMELQTMAASQTSTQRLLKDYFAQYNITPKLIVSVKRHIQDFHKSDNEQVNEAKIMGLLPRQLANDLLYEVRAPTITSNSLLYSLNGEFPRVVRHLCHTVVQSLPAHKWEIMFDRGDACSRVLFVERGEILYSMEVTEWSPDFGDPDSCPPGDPLRKGSCISEAALWMYWENCGRLIAGGPGSLLSMGAVAFEEEMREFKIPHEKTASYARKYVSEITAKANLGVALSDIDRKDAFGHFGRQGSASERNDRISFWIGGRLSHTFSDNRDRSNRSRGSF